MRLQLQIVFWRVTGKGIRLLFGLGWVMGWLCAPVTLWAADFGIQSGHMIVDQAGRLIQTEKPFKRLISLYGAHTENLFHLGLDQEIIGVTRNEAYPPRALLKPVFSYHDDPEKFLAARPDLILIRPMIDRGYPQLVQRLQKSRIVVVSLQPHTISDMYTYWQILGHLTGRQAQAKAMVAQFKAAVTGAQRLTEKIKKRRKVYFEAIHRKMKTFAPDSMAIFALEAAGGMNVARDALPVRNTNIAAYGKERILSKADEIEVYLAQQGVMNRVSVDEIKRETGFHVIRAVKRNQVYLIDEMIVSRPTMRLLSGMRTIGHILYPDVYGPAQGQP
jgi:iron complex transport system substrate-binding protein